MIDVHCHLLPGIDDGPDTLEEALALCRIAVADGISHAIVTPHIHVGRWENNCQSIHLECQSLQQELERSGIPLRLGYAAEVRLSDEIVAQLAAGEIPFYSEVDGFRIMLLEFPHSHVVPGSDRLADWLLQQGIRPLIAHPERNRQIMKDPAQLDPFVQMGCWLQVTAGSVTGNFGEAAKVAAHRLLEADVVAMIASDGHNARARPPVLTPAFEHVSRHFGSERAARLMLDNPATLVAAQFPQG